MDVTANRYLGDGVPDLAPDGIESSLRAPAGELRTFEVTRIEPPNRREDVARQLRPRHRPDLRIPLETPFMRCLRRKADPSYGKADLDQPVSRRRRAATRTSAPAAAIAHANGMSGVA